MPVSTSGPEIDDDAGAMGDIVHVASIRVRKRSGIALPMRPRDFDL